MSANEREILIGFGKNKQAALATANTAAGMWRLNKLNASNMHPKLNTEDDAPEFGKGHGHPTQIFPTSWDVQGQIEKYLSAEFAAHVMAFSLGDAVKTGTPPNYVYTCTPLDPVSDGIELPNFSFVEQMRPGASAIVDFMNVGCAYEGWSLVVGSGPGRANSKLTADVVGSGKFTEPSAIELPAATAEKLLPSASLAATINGVNYVSTKNFVSLEASWKNNHNMDDGFYPGSGFQGAQAQVETITLTGTEGTANVGAAGGLTKLATFGDDLADTAADFVTSHAAAYLAVGIVVTSEGADLIFTANVAGTGFTAPTITNATGDLAGTVAHTTANIALGDSGAIRGRLEIGTPVLGLQFVARYQYGSTEYKKLRAQTEGTAVISLTYDANNALELTYQRMVFALAERGGQNGIVTVQVTCKPMMHSANGLITAVAKCNVDGICEAES